MIYNSENVVQTFVRLAQHFLPATYYFNQREIFQLKAPQEMDILSGEQMRGPKIM